MTFLSKKTAASTPIIPINADSLNTWLKKQSSSVQSWVKAHGYKGTTGTHLIIPTLTGDVDKVLFGVGDDLSIYTYAALPATLPQNDAGYFIDKKYSKPRANEVALGWALGAYYFAKYKTAKAKTTASLIWPEGADKKYLETMAEAIYLVRDLVNTPASDLGPEEIQNAAENLIAGVKGATIKTIIGDDLVKQNYPMIYAVGKGSPRKPRLIDIRWGNAKHKKITLVGKGVAFDTGGLDIKPASGMYLMKKDMGGAAHVLGLAHLIIRLNLPVCLRVLIPAVENAVDGNSFRPSDILKTRKGITVEVGDTDAEGRLILADALFEGAKDKPEMLIDFATLTGAARVALGPELPAMFSNNDTLAKKLNDASAHTQDPLWQLPLWQPYKELLGSKIADTNNISTGGMAGAITAALFLEKFVESTTPWVHIDTFAWNNGQKPGRPEGGEALAMRAVFELIKTAVKK